MSEYKENTVGWWLSQLKEPLRSMALSESSDMVLHSYAYSIPGAIVPLMNSLDRGTFWKGVYFFFCGDSKDGLPYRQFEAWVFAKHCAPDNWLKPKDGGEDKAIVDSPEKPEKWIDQFKQDSFTIYPPEPAVIGYQVPLPTDTIEKKHELRIQNLEVHVKYLDDMVASLTRSLEIITEKLSKNG